MDAAKSEDEGVRDDKDEDKAATVSKCYVLEDVAYAQSSISLVNHPAIKLFS